MPRGKSKNINKSEWIRQQPESLTAKELIEKAKKKNITLTAQQIYTVRHDARNKADKTSTPVEAPAEVAAPTKGKPGRKPKVAMVAAAAPTTVAATKDTTPKGAVARIVSASTRQQFYALATRIGTETARDLLDEMESRAS